MTKVKDDKLGASVEIILAGKHSTITTERSGQTVTVPLSMVITALNEVGWTLKPSKGSK